MLAITLVLMPPDVAIAVRLERDDRDRSRQVLTKRGKQKEFAFRLHAGMFGQISPQVSFRQQIRKERRQASADDPNRCHQTSRTSLE